MKLLLILAMFSSSAMADNYPHWAIPLISGVAIGAIIGNTYQQRPPQYIPPPTYYPPSYSTPVYGHHYETIYDGYCGCYKTVLVLH